MTQCTRRLIQFTMKWSIWLVPREVSSYLRQQVSAKHLIMDLKIHCSFRLGFLFYVSVINGSSKCSFLLCGPDIIFQYNYRSPFCRTGVACISTGKLQQRCFACFIYIIQCCIFSTWKRCRHMSRLCLAGLAPPTLLKKASSNQRNRGLKGNDAKIIVLKLTPFDLPLENPFIQIHTDIIYSFAHFTSV